MGAYIVHFEETPEITPDGQEWYRSEEIPWWMTTKATIGRLIPYTEPDLDAIRKEAYDKGYTDAAYNCRERCAFLDDAKKEAYQRGYETAKRECGECNRTADCTHCEHVYAAFLEGREEMWEAAKMVELPHDHGGIGLENIKTVFGADNRGWVFKNMTAGEIINCVRKYKQSKAAEQADKNRPIIKSLVGVGIKFSKSLEELADVLNEAIKSGTFAVHPEREGE